MAKSIFKKDHQRQFAEALGHRLRVARVRANIGVYDMSRALDIREQSIYGYERGLSVPPVMVLQKIAKMLGVSYTYLIDGEQDAG